MLMSNDIENAFCVVLMNLLSNSYYEDIQSGNNNDANVGSHVHEIQF